MMTIYEVHWARSNAADKVVALRQGAQRHANRESAEREARELVPPRADLAPLVCEVSTETRK